MHKYLTILPLSNEVFFVLGYIHTRWSGYERSNPIAILCSYQVTTPYPTVANLIDSSYLIGSTLCVGKYIPMSSVYFFECNIQNTQGSTGFIEFVPIMNEFLAN